MVMNNTYILSDDVCQRICDELNTRLGWQYLSLYHVKDPTDFNSGCRLVYQQGPELGFFNYRQFKFFLYWPLREVRHDLRNNDELNIADPKFMEKLVMAIKDFHDKRSQML